ncbi:hypothetical protein HAX54_030500 [Datura stramonium]|uniref:Uncharacterized protein n=1 Tax=Datura stramonium TaxID=4076 RepID=A0ABS8SB14_DATST|nr:hypothetical protein [Datura stramonium]
MVKSAVGFRHVIDLLSSEQKLIVGHNCFLDMAHIYSKFIGPLRPTAEDYRVDKSSTSLSRAFVSICPQIALGVKTSGLADRPCVEVEVQVDEKRSSNWNSGAKHEAGYDAFMTGCIFAQACNHPERDFTSISSISKKLFADQAEAVGIKRKTVSSRVKKGNQVFDQENEVRVFDEKVYDQMSPPYGYSEPDRSAESFYLDEVLASK